jgi:peptidyl-prolyl cis-trans isomerase SurA
MFVPTAANAAGTQQVLAIVNDQPVTSRDVDQYLALQKLLGISTRGGDVRRRAAEDLINQIVKIEEAKLNKMNAGDKEIDSRIAEISKALKTDRKGLESKLKKQGIGLRTMNQWVASQIGFARLLRFKYKAEYKVDASEVDRRKNEINSKIKAEIDGKVSAYMRQFDKFKPVTVYNLMEINFPLDAPSGGTTNELLQARALDAIQYGKNFRSCSNARAAASGIFNVRIGKKIEADAAKLPAPLIKLLRSRGPGKAYGPMQTGNGLQMIAFCSERRIDPPKPKRPDVKYPFATKEQISGVVEAEGFEKFEKKFVTDMRRHMIIDYRDPSLSQ